MNDHTSGAGFTIPVIWNAGGRGGQLIPDKVHLIRSIYYYPDGTIQRIEYFPGVEEADVSSNRTAPDPESPGG